MALSGTTGLARRRVSGHGEPDIGLMNRGTNGIIAHTSWRVRWVLRSRIRLPFVVAATEIKTA
jgi:hypothetical protein